ncbi:MAG: histidine phosphatase family protein [Lachnospiraceae bacterium]|nr:histidine phosphatase family protein [Lachnospiraceae bacterium]
MKIWLTRHGQTNLNKKRLMQGLTDEPLNDTGRQQAREVHEKIGDVHFDAVYASPLSRAQETASIVGNVPVDRIIIDERIIEVDFGPYEAQNYYLLGPGMKLYWMAPELFPAPKGVETLQHQIDRSHAFLKELETKSYENVLIVCHGGIIRSMKGYLEDRKNGIVWRPRPQNCEVVVYETENGKHQLLKKI